MDIYNQSIIISSLKDILHLGIVYWNLILQLLRTNEQSKNVIHETIVIEPCDLQNIVFNSFSCYLNSKQSSGGSSLSKKLIKDIEEWLTTNSYKDENVGESDVLDPNDCDLNICDSLLLSDKQKGILDIQYDIDYTTVINFFYINGATFDCRNRTNFKNENSFSDNEILNSCDSIKDLNKSTESEYLLVSGVKKITNFLTNTVFDHFFVNTNIDKASDATKETKGDIDYSVYIKDYDTAECNSLFLQLFEITAGVMILANWEQPSSGKRN